MGKKSGLAFILGAAAGALAILFMPDDKRKQAKKMVESKAMQLQSKLQSVAADERIQAIFGKVSQETQKAYEQMRQELESLVKDLKEIDQGKYAGLVDQVIDKAKKGTELTTDQLTKLKKEFMSFYDLDKPKSKKAGK